MAKTQQISVREFQIRTNVTGREVITDKKLRKTGMNNKQADKILQSAGLSEEYVKKGLFPCWTPGTVVAHPKRGDGLTETIEYQGVTYIVQEETLKDHAGKQNLLLVLQRDFEIDTNLVINGKVAGVLTLPEGDGWRMPDLKFGIPQGPEVSPDNPEARFGYYFNNSAYIGPLVRGYDVYGDLRYISADSGLGLGFGVGWWPSQSLSKAAPEHVKQALDNGWLLDLHRTISKSEASIAKLEQTTIPEVLTPLRNLIKMARTLDIKNES